MALYRQGNGSFLFDNRVDDGPRVIGASDGTILQWDYRTYKIFEYDAVGAGGGPGSPGIYQRAGVLTDGMHPDAGLIIYAVEPGDFIVWGREIWAVERDHNRNLKLTPTEARLP
jgi:hypothetical protein